MRTSKRRLAIIFCCATCLTKPAYAFWPTFDFGESPTLVTNVNTTLDSLSEAKKQLEELDKCKKAIGESVKNLAEFSQSLNTLNASIVNVANNSVGAVNENLGTNITVQEELTGKLNEINNIQKQMAGDVVNQTNGALSTADKYSKDVTSNIDKAHVEGQKNQGSGEDEDEEYEEAVLLEEEEEEEEIAEASFSQELQEEIIAGFSAAKEENKQLAVELNDFIDTALVTLNESAQENKTALELIKQTLGKTEEISEKRKGELLQKLEKLDKKEQTLTERVISVAENAKSRYNAEYTNKVEDGIKNYEKTVLAYLNQSAEKAEVIAAGERLKKSAASMDFVPDAKVLNEIKKETNLLQKEMADFAEAVKKAEQERAEAKS